jgi:hypothetical protein
VPAVRKSIGGVLGPELTHIGPIVIDTSAEILASQETFIFDEVDPVTLVSLNTDGNFVFVDVAASDDGTFGKSLSIDAYFPWTSEQDGFVAAKALITHQGEATAFNGDTSDY